MWTFFCALFSGFRPFVEIPLFSPQSPVDGFSPFLQAFPPLFHNLFPYDYYDD